jgi:RND family efflux transporter MFP subunit
MNKLFRLSYTTAWIALWALSPIQPAAAIETAAAHRTEVTIEAVFDGIIEAVNQTTVSAETAGQVQAILFDTDDFVQRNDIIVRLRDVAQQARLKQAQQGLQEARARLTEASANFERNRKLLSEKTVSKAVYDKAEADLKATRARVSKAEAAVAEAQDQLERTLVRAPYSGIVVERLVEVGAVVQPGTPLMSGLSLDQLRASTQIPERLIGTVREFHTAYIRVPGSENETLKSEDMDISPRAHPQSHTFEVRVNLPEAVAGLYPGMSVKVAIVTGKANKLLVPERAIIHRSEVTGVYVVDNGRVSLRQVRIGRMYNGEREVLAGLEPGEQVALDPVAAGIQLKQQQ